MEFSASDCDRHEILAMDADDLEQLLTYCSVIII